MVMLVCSGITVGVDGMICHEPYELCLISVALIGVIIMGAIYIDKRLNHV